MKRRISRSSVFWCGFLTIGGAVVSAAGSALEGYGPDWGLREWAQAALSVLGAGFFAARAFLDQSISGSGTSSEESVEQAEPPSPEAGPPGEFDPTKRIILSPEEAARLRKEPEQ